MQNYFTSYLLLGLDNGNLPVHHGMRKKRYESVEKMMDLLDVVKRIGPKFPVDALFLDPTDTEWDDDMTYLYIDHAKYRNYLFFLSAMSVGILYNYNFLFKNKIMQGFTKIALWNLFFGSNVLYYKYRKQLLRCNLFDEYVQLRADELVKEREHLLYTEQMKKFIWYSEDLKETLLRIHRQAYKNDPTDFADSELLLQDFVRRYTDDTLEMPLNLNDHKIYF